MNNFLTSNAPSMRLLRSIIQGVLALIPGIINFYLPYMPEWVGLVIAPVIMCILSPIMAELGNAIEKHGGVENE